jgi:hypothetical protein
MNNSKLLNLFFIKYIIFLIKYKREVKIVLWRSYRYPKHLLIVIKKVPQKSHPKSFTPEL